MGCAVRAEIRTRSGGHRRVLEQPPDFGEDQPLASFEAPPSKATSAVRFRGIRSATSVRG